MEFGIVGFDGFDHHQQLSQGKPKFNNSNNINGSGLIKLERSDPFNNEDNKVSKMGKLDNDDDIGLRSDNNNNNNDNSNNNVNNNKQQMLSFSLTDNTYTNNKTSAGFGCGNMNGSMHASFTGIRGPFTPAQWIELEHQAMIYKYLTANVPVPSNLLIPIRKAIHSAGFPGFSFGSYPSHSYGWGAFHLGFSGNTDPEPGRCRRTDGKKWRCSRDAVPDQKYCERHINRGRHRSRKPVEGHTGQAASGAAATKVVPPMSASVSSLATPRGSVPTGIAIEHHHIKGLQPSNNSTDPVIKRLNDQQGLSVMPPTINLESKDSQYSIPKQHISFHESSVSDFGVVSNDSFLNPTQKSSYLDCKNYNSLLDFNIQQSQDQNPLRHFMDDWPKDQTDHSDNPWSKDPKSDWTQLSMSIPMSTDFSSSSSSPNREKTVVSPLRLSCELDPFQVGLGVGGIVSERGAKQNAWTPISWGNSNSMGGPLGEVLLNNARWDESPQLGNSPTGVLQKSTFVSVSNSSSGGSPRGGPMRTLESASICDDLLGSAARASSASIPSV